MRSSLRSVWLAVKSSYWFIPTLMTLFAVLLAIVTIHLDRIWAPAWLAGWFEAAGPKVPARSLRSSPAR